MTLSEKRDIVEMAVPELVNTLWQTREQTNTQKYQIAVKKLERMRAGISDVVSGKPVLIDQIVAESSTAWKTPEWEFPKGRRNIGEDMLECALREFKEETGIAIRPSDICADRPPFEETFVGSNGTAYKHVYFLAQKKVPNETELGALHESQFLQVSEVSDAKWLTTSECRSVIRSNSVEKKYVLEEVCEILKLELDGGA